MSLESLHTGRRHAMCGRQRLWHRYSFSAKADLLTARSEGLRMHCRRRSTFRHYLSPSPLMKSVMRSGCRGHPLYHVEGRRARSSTSTHIVLCGLWEAWGVRRSRCCRGSRWRLQHVRWHCSGRATALSPQATGACKMG